VTINLIDENDNKPIYQMDACEATLNEDLSDLTVDKDGNHILGLNIIATDKDISETYSTASIVYELEPPPNNGFTIKTTPSAETGNPVGQLYIEKNKNPFDFESSDTYSFQVRINSFGLFTIEVYDGNKPNTVSLRFLQRIIMERIQISMKNEVVF
jgi:hypothetical protein